MPPCFMVCPHSWRNTNIFPATNACLRVIEYSEWNSFDYALSGPFNKQLSAGSQHPLLSVSASFIFISTSTVSIYLTINCLKVYTLEKWFVKDFFAVYLSFLSVNTEYICGWNPQIMRSWLLLFSSLKRLATESWSNIKLAIKEFHIASTDHSFLPFP